MVVRIFQAIVGRGWWGLILLRVKDNAVVPWLSGIKFCCNFMGPLMLL